MRFRSTVFSILTGLVLLGASPSWAQVEEFSGLRLFLQDTSSSSSPTLLGNWSLLPAEYGNPQGGLMLVDCIPESVSVLGLGYSNTGWRRLGLRGTIPLQKRITLDFDCGILLGNSFRNLMLKGAAVMAALTFHFI